jgi:hypothetical protein
MRSILTGMLISLITVFFGTWFLSSSILKMIKQPEISSALKSKNRTEKPYHGDSSYSDNTSEEYYYEDEYCDSPFGEKLTFEKSSNPFGPKLSLRQKRYKKWNRKKKTYSKNKYYKQTSQKRNSISKSNDSSDIISDFKSYIDAINDQMD